MRKQNRIIALLLGSVAVVAAVPDVHAASLTGVYYTGGATDAAYWTAVADFSGAPNSPAVGQSQHFGSVPPSGYLASTWTYVLPESVVSASLPAPQVAAAHGSIPTLVVQPSGAFNLVAHTDASAAADYAGALPDPTLPLLNGASGQAAFGLNIAANGAGQIQLAGNFSSTNASELKLSFTEYNSDGSLHYAYTPMDVFVDTPINVTYPLVNGRLYNLSVQLSSGMSADAASLGDASEAEATGDLNLQSTISVPEPAIIAAGLLVCGALVSRRREFSL